MPKFAYVVKDKSGKSFTDVVEAASANVLVKKLQQQNFFIVSVKEVSATASTQKASYKTKKKHKFTHNKVKLQDLITFARQLATMLESGVTLVRSLDVILSQIQSRQFNQTMLTIKKDVEQGNGLSLALSKHPKVFNQFWVSLVEVGEASGTVPMVLNKLSFYLEQQAEFKSTIISGIIYPAILFCISIGAVAFFALFVGPRFEAIFTTMGVELPLITVVLLGIFAFIKKQFLFIILGIAGTIFLFKGYIKTYHGKLKWEQFLFSLPTVGEIYQFIVIERFSSQMAILIDAGVPILYSLDIAERLVDNNTCAAIISDIKNGVKGGELLVAPMARSGFFPPMGIQMITVGEETGELSKMLKYVAKYYQDYVATFMKRFSTIVEPFMLVFMGAVIGTIVLAMFLPMFNITQLGGGGGG